MRHRLLFWLDLFFANILAMCVSMSISIRKDRCSKWMYLVALNSKIHLPHTLKGTSPLSDMPFLSPCWIPDVLGLPASDTGFTIWAGQATTAGSGWPWLSPFLPPPILLNHCLPLADWCHPFWLWCKWINYCTGKKPKHKQTILQDREIMNTKKMRYVWFQSFLHFLFDLVFSWEQQK